jgi:hypothetical protein
MNNNNHNCIVFVSCKYKCLFCVWIFLLVMTKRCTKKQVGCVEWASSVIGFGATHQSESLGFDKWLSHRASRGCGNSEQERMIFPTNDDDGDDDDYWKCVCCGRTRAVFVRGSLFNLIQTVLYVYVYVYVGGDVNKCLCLANNTAQHSSTGLINFN